ncbi:MAG: DUF484 family protein [Rhodospirillales bacterium]|nr:DUF484 family protein [Rhodospirillales bacterium]
MAESESSAALAGAAPPTGAAVAEYLRRHPDFLIEHPDLLWILTPPAQRSDNGVVDMQRYMLERMRTDLAKLTAAQAELIATSRANLATQGRIHAAVLSVLTAKSLPHCIDTIAVDLPMHLEVDAIGLGFESLEHVPPGENAQNLRILPRGTVDRLMGERRDILLLSDEPGDSAIYGGASTLVHSQALLRLQLKRDMPPGILAFGARATSKFHPGQGTELLNFLGRTVEAALRGWLARGN